jgi:predicted GNAT superfamily acetyltransferase
MTDRVEVRAGRVEDLSWVLPLNDSEIPHVSLIRRSPFDGPQAGENRLIVALRAGEPLGFLLGMTLEANYDSPNFLWFCERERDLFYVDRIVVAAQARGLGLGRLLYTSAAALAPPPLRRIGCEVNLAPPNPQSLAFHTRLGFREVGRQAFVPGEKEVVYLVCDGVQLAPPGASAGG